MTMRIFVLGIYLTLSIYISGYYEQKYVWKFYDHKLTVPDHDYIHMYIVEVRHRSLLHVSVSDIL
jgi:hypothetical protein